MLHRDALERPRVVARPHHSVAVRASPALDSPDEAAAVAIVLDTRRDLSTAKDTDNNRDGGGEDDPMTALSFGPR